MIKKGEPLDRGDLGLLATALVLAHLPDVDLVPITVYGFSAVKMFHQAYTHNMAFCLISSLIASLLASVIRKKPFMHYFPFFSLLVFSHILLDAMGHDTNPPIGVQLLWPLSSSYFLFPVHLFIGVAKSTARELFSLWNLMAVLVELIVFLPIVGVIRVLNQKRWLERMQEET